MATVRYCAKERNSFISKNDKKYTYECIPYCLHRAILREKDSRDFKISYEGFFVTCSHFVFQYLRHSRRIKYTFSISNHSCNGSVG